MRKGIVITRGRLAQIASFVGIGGIIIGLIGLIWRSGTVANYAVISLGVGIAGLVLWAVLTPREFADTITGKKVRNSTITIVTALLLIGIIALTYLLLTQAAFTLDMTQNRNFTLSSETKQLLNRINRPIQLTGFYTSRNLRSREVDEQFFRQYTVESDGLIHVQYIDPEESPAMANAYGATFDGQLFISYLDAEGNVDSSSLARVPRGVNQERDITQAISRLLMAGSIKVYFETGLGERETLDSGTEGLTGINSGIQESGMITAPLNLAEIAENGGGIPSDAAAVIFARPLRDLTQSEVDVISRYLDRGGSLLIMSDVLFTDDAFLKEDGVFNQYLWDNYGIRALDAAVVDPDASGQTPLDIISAAVFTDTDIGARLDPSADTPTLFRLARPVEVNLTSAPPNVANGRVIMTTTSGWGETDLAALGATNTYSFDAASDITGPVSTVVWSSNLTNDSRIVLIGDSDFVTNGQVLNGGNGILFTDSLVWISHYGEQIEFAPQAFAAGLPTIFVSQQQIDFVVFLTVLLMPAAMLVAGLSVWGRRARR
ncbi:MAG: GldG family protein [Anaerolineae bacterium]|nr:GldG family protein [Anaerolineae bacterium]